MKESDICFLTGMVVIAPHVSLWVACAMTILLGLLWRWLVKKGR